MTGSTVVIDNVAKAYGRTLALAGVTLAFAPGVTGLLGPNGAGKTTLLRILATVLSPDTGRVRLLERDPSVPAERIEIRRRLGYVPQEPGFHRSFTAFEFTDYVAILKEMTDRRARHDEVARVLAEVGLSDVAGKRIRALSGGMRRRLALAQALLGRPELLILDEPTAGLDPEQRLRFREVISRIAERSTVILSTHQTEDVAAVCQRVAVINEGVVRFEGSAAELAEQARGRVWLSEAAAPEATLSWRTAENLHRNIGTPPRRSRLVEPTIEDAYLLLIGRQRREDAA